MSTATITAQALRLLAAEIQAPDDVPACCLRDAADQLDAQAAEIERLRAELAVERQCRNGHLPDCAGIDLEQMRCGCGYLDGTAYRSLADEIERLKAECIREHDREFAPFCEQSERADKADARVAELGRELADVTNGAQCRMEERDSARREREDYKRRLIEAEDSLAAQHRRADKAEARVEKLEALLLAVKCGEFSGITCDNVNGRCWFDARDAALAKREGGR